MLFSYFIFISSFKEELLFTQIWNLFIEIFFVSSEVSVPAIPEINFGWDDNRALQILTTCKPLLGVKGWLRLYLELSCQLCCNLYNRLLEFGSLTCNLSEVIYMNHIQYIAIIVVLFIWSGMIFMHHLKNICEFVVMNTAKLWCNCIWQFIHYNISRSSKATEGGGNIYNFIFSCTSGHMYK